MNLAIDVSKSFGSFSLSASLHLGGMRTGVFGESGSGKSTLVHLLAGTLAPDSGRIELDGETLFDSGARINIPPQRRRIGLVFQHPYLFPHLSVRKNLLYGYRRCSRNDRCVHPEEIVSALGLGHLLERPVSNLSGGEKQRVGLGRAVLANPRLLIMDEPLSALDDGLKHRIIPYLNTITARFSIPVLFISHSLLEMRLMTDEVVVLEKGAVADHCATDELARKRLDLTGVGYINLLTLREPHRSGGLFLYRWGDGEMVVSTGTEDSEKIFELSSKDIILFKKNPEAASARNLIPCRVSSIFRAGAKVGVELLSAGGSLIAEVVPQAARELGISPGIDLYAAVKASAFRPL